MSKGHGKKGTFHRRAKHTKHHENDPLFDQIDDWLRMYLEDAFASMEVEYDTGDESEDLMANKTRKEAEE